MLLIVFLHGMPANGESQKKVPAGNFGISLQERQQGYCVAKRPTPRAKNDGKSLKRLICTAPRHFRDRMVRYCKRRSWFLFGRGNQTPFQCAETGPSAAEDVDSPKLGRNPASAACLPRETTSLQAPPPRGKLRRLLATRATFSRCFFKT